MLAMVNITGDVRDLAHIRHYESFVAGSGLGLGVSRFQGGLTGPSGPQLIGDFFKRGRQAFHVFQHRACCSFSQFCFVLRLFYRASRLQHGVFHWRHNFRIFMPHQHKTGQGTKQNHVPTQELDRAVLFEAAGQTVNQLCIKASPSLICRFVDVFVEIGRHSQSGADVVVLSHGAHSTRRLQNGVDTKMKPNYIHCAASN